MVISQGDVCWADLDAPAGSAPGLRRPVAIVQGDSFNASRIATVANVSQLLSIDRTLLTDRVGHLAASELQLVLAGIDLVLGRE
jgi:mRNA interferase MazF